MRIEPLGDSAILLTFGETANPEVHHWIQSFLHAVSNRPFSWMTEASPAFTSIAIFYDPIKIAHVQHPFDQIKQEIESFIDNIDMTSNHSRDNHIVDIPVCYGGEFGPDLGAVASLHHITPNELIRLHSDGQYLVHMIGFTPGFPYLGGMTEKLATPRRSTPRLVIPAGSVGIAGSQTGVYPLDSPGGWNIIGRTPIPLFRPNQDPPSLLKTGDIVRFYPISAAEFIDWELLDGDH